MEIFPGQVAMPTSALVMVGPLAENPVLCAMVRESFVEGTMWAKDHPEEAGKLAIATYPELGGILGTVSGSLQEIFRSSRLLDKEQGKQAALFMLERLLEINPASIGGRMPDKKVWGEE